MEDFIEEITRKFSFDKKEDILDVISKMSPESQVELVKSVNSLDLENLDSFINYLQKRNRKR